jgi:carbonic anhydrase
VLQFAVEVLKVRHVLVVGHYGCGGVRAALEDKRHGLLDHWLQPIRNTAERHRDELAALPDQAARTDRLVELNVIRQVRSVASDVFVRDAWKRGQSLTVHGWVYSLNDGLVHDLGINIASPADYEAAPRA